MRALHSVIAVLALATVPAAASAQPKCTAPALSDQQVKEIVDKERASRTDLPPRFGEYKWAVRRQGCHYVYIETGLPHRPDNDHTFKLNQFGVLVDADTISCPETTLSERQLIDIVKNERAKRSDLPPPFPNVRTDVVRNRCLYALFEYAVPETRGNYQVFTIDPLGELMEFLRSRPY